MAPHHIMKTEAPLRLLIADPDGTRLATLIRATTFRQDVQAVGASTIAEVYRQCEAFMPERVALASEFTRVTGLQEMSDLFAMIGAEVVVYDAELSNPVDTVLPPKRKAAPLPIPRRQDQKDTPKPPRVQKPADSVRAPMKPVAPKAVVAPKAPIAPVSERRAPVQPMPARPPQTSRGQERPDILAIGASTGGIAAIEKILATFPADCPPTLVVQHIHRGFAEGLVRRLDGLVQPKVIAGEDGMELQAGQICFATADDRHLTAISRAGLRVKLVDGPEISGHRPSVDALFESLAALSDRFRIAACLLTGMGADGADGMAKLRRNGAFTIAQDKDSSVVWGMPQAAILRGGADAVLPLEHIADALLTGRIASLSQGSFAR